MDHNEEQAWVGRISSLLQGRLGVGRSAADKIALEIVITFPQDMKGPRPTVLREEVGKDLLRFSLTSDMGKILPEEMANAVTAGYVPILVDRDEKGADYWFQRRK